MKQCTKCKQLLSKDQFHKDKTTRDGFKYQCKDCKKVYDKIYKMANAEKITRWSKKHYKRNAKKYKVTSIRWSRKNPEYIVWRNIICRCIKPENKDHEYYGGRGITICQRWLDSFANFFKDMGKRPSPKHTIDRIDNNGNYELSNCRWVTMKEQNNNKRSIRKIHDAKQREDLKKEKEER